VSPNPTMAEPASDGAAQANTPHEVDGTVFKNPHEAPLVTHPLENDWVFWFDNPRKGTSMAAWAGQLKRVCAINSIEDFWRLYNNIRPPSLLTTGQNYWLFKRNIEPKWEDPANESGGRWMVNMARSRSDILDACWEKLLLAAVGAQFSAMSEINGIVVSVRSSQNRLQIWTANGNNKDATLRIGRELKQILKLDGKIFYVLHSSSQTQASKKLSSAAHYKYELE